MDSAQASGILPERHRDVLVFAAPTLQQLQRTLLLEAPLETACFLLAHAVETPTGRWRLIVHDILELEADEYVRRSATEIDLPPSTVARVMQRARASNSSVVLTHSHPFPGIPSPSTRDLAGEAKLVPVIRGRVSGVPHARLIVSPDGIHASLFDIEGLERPLEVMEVGAGLEVWDSDGSVIHKASDVHDRQVRAFGEYGQHRLTRLRVAVIGLGGTGSVVTQQLAHLGVGNFLLVDPDVIQFTNLNRVVGARRSDVGRPKVEVGRDVIAAINPAARIEVRRADVCDRDTARALLDVDIFFCCTDSHGSRAVLAQLAYQYLVPGIDLGVVIQAGPTAVTHISGRVQMLAPELPCLLCTGVLDPEAVRRDLLTDAARARDPYIEGAAVPQPAVISINSAAGSLAVTMLLSVVTGIPVAARNQQLRLELGIVSRIEGKPQPGCPVCSVEGAALRGDSWSPPGRRS